MLLRDQTSLVTALLSWAYHEAAGKHSGQLKRLQPLLRSRSREADQAVLGELLRTRAPLVARILEARPLRVHHIDFEPSDLPRIAVLEHGLADFAKAGSGDGEAHIRSLEQLDFVRGPLLAVAPHERGPWCVLDGVHRATAWARHASAGRHYPVEAYVVVTERPTMYEQVRFPEARSARP